MATKVAIDLVRLRALANAATPGPWVATDYGDYSGKFQEWYVDTTAHKADVYLDPEGGVAANHWNLERGKHDMEFVAAANPAVILALLDHIAELQQAQVKTSEQPK